MCAEQSMSLMGQCCVCCTKISHKSIVSHCGHLWRFHQFSSELPPVQRHLSLHVVIRSFSIRLGRDPGSPFNEWSRRLQCQSNTKSLNNSSQESKGTIQIWGIDDLNGFVS